MELIWRLLKKKRMEGMDLDRIEKLLQAYAHKLARCFLDYTGRAIDYYKFEKEIYKLIKKYIYKSGI